MKVRVLRLGLGFIVNVKVSARVNRVWGAVGNNA